MKKILLTSYFLVLILSSCENNLNDSVNEKKENESESTLKPTSNQESITVKRATEDSTVNNIDDAFTPPNFKVNDFKIKKDKKNKVKFIVNYTLSPNSKIFLKENKPEIYFNILYSDNIQQLSGHMHSEFNKVDFENDRLTSTISLNDSFDSQFDTEIFNDSSENLKLQLLDGNKKIFHVFDSVNLYSSKEK